MKLVNLALATAALAGAAAMAMTAPVQTVFSLTSMDANGADPQTLIEPASYPAGESAAFGADAPADLG